MTHHVLLLTADSALAARLQRALPQGLELDCKVSSRYLPAPDGQGWLLILWDDRLEGAVNGGRAAQRRAGGGEAGAPVIRLGAGGGAGPGVAGPLGEVVDAVSREACASKLAFVLREHCATAYMHWVRRRPTPRRGEGAALQEEFNNTLTGLLGNAALALDGAGRIPVPLKQRLQRICSLAGRLRDLSGALAPPH